MRASSGARSTGSSLRSSAAAITSVISPRHSAARSLRARSVEGVISSYNLLISRHKVQERSGMRSAKSRKVLAMRCGASKISTGSGLFSIRVSASFRFRPWRGKKPKKKKLASTNPEAPTAAVTALAPGIGHTAMPRA